MTSEYRVEILTVDGSRWHYGTFDDEAVAIDAVVGLARVNETIIKPGRFVVERQHVVAFEVVPVVDEPF